MVVGVMGLLRPVERAAVVAAAPAVVPDEWAMLDLAAGEEAALGDGGEAAAEPAAAVTERAAAVEDLPEPVVALTPDDVFQVPAARPVEPLVTRERPEPTPTPSREAVRPAAARKPAAATGPAGSAGSTAGRPTGSATGAGAGGGGGTAAGGRGGGSGYFPTPPYPSQARSRGQQGTVQLSIVFGTDGRVTGASVSRSSGYSELDRAASQWVRRHWRAAAGQVGTFRLPVHFKLR